MTNHRTAPKDRMLPGLRVPRALCGLLLAPALLLASCTSYAPPSFRISGVTIQDETDDAMLLNVSLNGVNSNPEELPLVEIRYSFSLDDRVVFSGSRSPELTLPRQSERMFDIPVPIPGENDSLMAGVAEYRFAATVVYEIPGTIAEVLFDTNLRRPSTSFAETGRVSFVPTVEPE